MYSKSYFVERFKGQENEILVERLATNELTDEAKDAITEVLLSQGYSADALRDVVVSLRKRKYRETKGNKNCDYCNSSARIRPIFDEGQRFCSDSCLRGTRILEASLDIPDDEILRHASALKVAHCPICDKAGGVVEARNYHRVYSIIYFTSVTDKTKICCIPCGRKLNIESIIYSFFLGWWGLPFGVIVTPAQIVANFIEIFNRKDSGGPSDDLIAAARVDLTERYIREGRLENISLPESKPKNNSEEKSSDLWTS